MDELTMFFYEEALDNGEDWESLEGEYIALEEYTGNMPCDTYGPAACGPFCPHWIKCTKGQGFMPLFPVGGTRWVAACRI